MFQCKWIMQDERIAECEFVSSTNHPKIVEAMPLFYGKVEILNYPRSKEREGMSWTGLVNGCFLDRSAVWKYSTNTPICRLRTRMKGHSNRLSWL